MIQNTIYFKINRNAHNSKEIHNFNFDQEVKVIYIKKLKFK